ncbi:hypothetical protein SESBI_49266, partial [Sesbania bispinosa]
MTQSTKQEKMEGATWMRRKRIPSLGGTLLYAEDESRKAAMLSFTRGCGENDSSTTFSFTAVVGHSPIHNS